MPVILLHGLSGSRRSYDAVVEHLVGTRVKRGEIQLFNVDVRGHGDSTRATFETYDAPSYAADVAALVEQLVDRPAVVVGHSLGGVVAAQLAAARPDLVRALFLEDPPSFEGDAERRNASPVATFFPLLVAAVRDLQARDAPLSDYQALATDTTPPDEVEARGDGLRRWDPTTMEAALAGVFWRGFDPVAPFAGPLTILRADPEFGAVFQPADAPLVLEANPHARIILMWGATHNIHGAPTRPAYLEQLDAFLDSVIQ